MIEHETFVKELLDKFPEVSGQIDPKVDCGLLHLEMSAFARFTREQIEARDRVTVTECFQFADRLLRNGDDAVVNAVNVSFLENLDFEQEDERWAFDCMPTRVREAWREIAAHNDTIHGTNIADRVGPKE